MRLGNLLTLREALGGRNDMGDLVISQKYACALKKAAGIIGPVFFDVDAVVAWRKKNPNFKITDVYANSPVSRPPSCNQKGPSVATAGKSRERS